MDVVNCVVFVWVLWVGCDGILCCRCVVAWDVGEGGLRLDE